MSLVISVISFILGKSSFFFFGLSTFSFLYSIHLRNKLGLSKLAVIIVGFCKFKKLVISEVTNFVAVAVTANIGIFGYKFLNSLIFKYSGRKSCPHTLTQ